MPDETMFDELEYEIPPFIRKPTEGSRDAGQFWLSCINAKLRKLEALGLRPHPTLLEHKFAMESWARGEGLGESFPPTMKRASYF